MRDSIIMNMNPYQVYQATANIYVEAETPEIAIAVITAYQSYFTGNLAVSNDALLSEVNTAYLKELVSYEIVTAAGNMLTITVSYSDNEGVQQLMSALLAAANDATAYIQQEIAPHSVSILSSPTILRTSQNLEKRQSDYATSLATLKAEQETIQSELSALTSSSNVTNTNPVIVAFIGAFIGAAIVVCFTCIRHLLTDKVYSARTLKNRTGIKVLGCIPFPGKRSKIDTLLRKFENRACHPEQAAVAAAAVIHHCRDAKHLLIIGNYDSAILAVFQDAFAQTGISVTDGKHILYSVVGTTALAECDAVLLLETCNQSLCADISKAVETIADHDKRLLGCVLIGG